MDLALRNQRGIYLMELMVAIAIGTIFLTALYGTSVGFYRATATNENQVMASNMAQQVIDNARSCTYSHLSSLLNGGTQASQSISLYQYPSSPSSSMFPRPLLRNMSSTSGMTYSQPSVNKSFHGSVTETIQNLNTGSAANAGTLRVTVVVAWTDTLGSHRYRTATTIAQTGIHN